MHSPKRLDPVQQRQEDQYQLPYHYIPSLKPGRFTQHLHWDWGFRYLGGLHLVTEELKKLPFRSLVDIGCGDGRFLRELKALFPDRTLLGIDYSERAIALASALNPGLQFACLDILQQPPVQRFDIATLVEVLEHIEPARLPEFLAAAQSCLEERHVLVITVPHVNKPLIPKHYQHFNASKLRALLEKSYSDLRFIPFDVLTARAPLLRLALALMGGKGKLFLVTNKRLLYAFYLFYLRRYLYTPTEANCERIAVICRK